MINTDAEMGGLGFTEEDIPEKVIDLSDAKRQAFAYWTVGGRDYRLKLTTANVERLENKYKTNIINLVMQDGIPPRKDMLTIIQAAMLPWEHGIKYQDIQKLFDQYVEEGGSDNSLLMSVIVPVMAVSGFFTPDQSAALMEAASESL